MAQIVTVTDDQLKEQMRFFADSMNMVAEPTACLAAAAVINGLVDVSGSRVGILVSGGNVSARTLGEILSNL